MDPLYQKVIYLKYLLHSSLRRRVPARGWASPSATASWSGTAAASTWRATPTAGRGSQHASPCPTSEKNRTHDSRSWESRPPRAVPRATRACVAPESSDRWSGWSPCQAGSNGKMTPFRIGRRRRPGARHLDCFCQDATSNPWNGGPER